MTARPMVLALLLYAVAGAAAHAAAGAALKKLVYERAFGDWTATVVKDLALNRNNCRLGTSSTSGDTPGGGETETATLRLDLVMRAHSTTWSSAIFLPQVTEKSTIALAIDGTIHHDLGSEFVSSSTAYLSDEFSHVLLQDFLTGELLDESITVNYRDSADAHRVANFSLDGFSAAKKSLEEKCAAL